MAVTTADGVRHIATVERTDGGFQMRCTCGEQVRGLWRHARRLAAGDLDAHLCQVSDVPEAERCTQSKAHRTRPWERCPLCIGQLPAFDLEEIGGER